LNISAIISLLSNPEVLNFFGSYLATKALDSTTKRITKLSEPDSFESQIISVLSSALQETCEHFDWEYDSSAIIDTYITTLSKIKNLNSAEHLRSILSEAVGNTIIDSEFDFWIDSFNKAISKPCHLWVYNYLLKNEPISTAIANISDRELQINIINSKFEICGDCISDGMGGYKRKKAENNEYRFLEYEVSFEIYNPNNKNKVLRDVKIEFFMDEQSICAFFAYDSSTCKKHAGGHKTELLSVQNISPNICVSYKINNGGYTAQGGTLTDLSKTNSVYLTYLDESNEKIRVLISKDNCIEKIKVFKEE